MLNGLDLFSGIGGISLALREWVCPIAYCEIDPYCQRVLLSKMVSGELPSAPIWDDITTLEPTFMPLVDIIYGGFPCQDISVAGNGKGLEGERSGLFFEILRVAEEIKPKFIFLENVPAITTRGGLRVVREITERGYDCRWCVISAASIGALHRRERWFLLAHANDDGPSSSKGRGSIRECTLSWKGSQEQTESIGAVERTSSLPSYVADTLRQGSQKRQEKRQSKTQEIATLRAYSDPESIRLWQEIVSSMGRTANGLPKQVDRIRSLGNAVVPLQAKEAFKMLMGLVSS